MRPDPTHISFAQLIDIVESSVPPALPADLESHLATCSACAGNLAWLARAINLMRTDASEDAPRAAVEHAKRQFRPTPVEELPSLRAHIWAILRLDTAQHTLTPGLRAGQMTTRQLLFGAGEYDLDIRLAPAGDTWQLAGQVLGADAGGRVELRGATIRVEAALNDLSEFDLRPVPSGRYSLVLHLAKVDIEIQTLDIGAPDATK